ncbi:MAG: ribosome maturation factor RimP [Acutalibacteraceae bacterium]|nr:ribosome maturation factor RimP [Acutalibacteraceae bacterium]
MANAAERVYSLIEETVKNEGVTLWDVRFLKEGANWYLRVFIDKPEGISIDDCTAVSHAIDPIIDEADPIDKSYFLEVCSPGIERELTRPWHYEAVLGEKIKIKLYKALDGKKEFTGLLKTSGDTLIIETETGEMTFPKETVSKAYLCDFDID